jgi:hypothetical protein
MFTDIARGCGQDHLIEIADRHGLIVGCWMSGQNWGHSQPALVGDTYSIKDALKAAGARWQPAGKCWVFTDDAALEAAMTGLEG